MLIDFDWFNQEGVSGTLSLVYNIISIIRIVVPVVLVIMTTMDIISKVINPNEKDGQKKILIRAIAALVVFLSPVFINFILKLANIDPSDNGFIDSDDNVINNGSTKELMINNCPSSLNVYHSNDRISLNTNISSSYNGSIIWSIKNNNHNVSITPSSDKKSANIVINNVVSSGTAIIEVTGEGQKASCSINYNIDELNDLDITNCPTTLHYNKDSIVLDSNIPSNYTGPINWSIIKGNNIATISTINGKKSASVNLSNVITNGEIKVELTAGGKKITCPISYDVTNLSSVSITNCPSGTMLYTIGDKINLSTDIPDDHIYVNWSVDDSNSVKVSPSPDKRSATVEITNQPKNNYVIIKTMVDDVEGNCVINLRNDQLTDMKITNCPVKTTVFHNNDTLSLNTDIPSDYTGDISWELVIGNEVTSISPSSDKRYANIRFSNIKNKGLANIRVKAGDKTNSCTINYDIVRLNSLSITNCPLYQNKYYIGDTINLNTDIPLSFNEGISWKIDNESAVSLIPSSDKKSASISILDHPKMGYVIALVGAGGQYKSCLINISAVKELQITNCPSSSSRYRVGDKITLYSNLPSFYKGDIIWESTNSSKYINIRPSASGREAEIEIKGVPDSKFITVGLGADSKGASCGFYVQN